MPFLYEGVHLRNSDPRLAVGRSPRGFRIGLMHHEPDHGSMRWTVDTPEDLEFVRQVFARLGDKESFSWYDVLALVQREPELSRINAAIHHKTMTDIDTRRK